MAVRFWRRVRIAPGVTVNLSKSGASLSFGPRGAKFTVGPRGRRATVGLPGTGLFYTTTLPSGRRTSYAPEIPLEDRLTLGFFKKLFTPPEERALVDACRELVRGDEELALIRAREATHLADGAFLAGALALKKGLLDEAIGHLEDVARREEELGEYFSRYDITPIMSIQITDEVSAHVGPDIRGVLLMLAEAYQRSERLREALRTMEWLHRLEPDDVLVRLSLAELKMEAEPGEETCCEVVHLAKDVENDSPVHTALLLYKARALRDLGLLTAAKDVLTQLLRRRSGRSDELLRAVRYERALIYEQMGQRGRARKDLETIYAEAPDYEDVAARLGLA